ncbi:unnamed protein product [Caenorhabditis nigoni]
MEKFRLVFIFSRPVIPGFLKTLKDAKCVLKLNDHRKMTYFSSPDGTAFKSQQSSNQIKYFKGKPENYKKKSGVKPARRTSQNVRNPSPASIPPVIPNPPEIDDVEMKKRRKKLQDRNFELNENNTFPSQPERILQQLQKRQWDFWQFSTSRRRSKADTAGYLRKNLMFNDYKNI